MSGVPQLLDKFMTCSRFLIFSYRRLGAGRFPMKRGSHGGKKGQSIPELVYHVAMIRELERILNHFGLTGNYRRVTLGKGVVGKSTSGFIGLCGVFGLVAIGLIIAGQPLYLLALALLIALVYLYYQYSIVGFATKNPASALLEGADFVKWHQNEIAAKDFKVIPNEPLIVDPQNPIQLEQITSNE